MKTYEEVINGKRWWYFYDKSIRLWTVFEVDENDDQINTADYYHDKYQMLAEYNFNFKTK